MTDIKDNTPALRFPGFMGIWSFKRLDTIIKRISIPVDVSDEELYQQIGIRSHGKGLFYKEAVTGKELGNKRVFWVTENAFIVNIVFAWEQAVAKTTIDEIGMIASHRFPMYQPIPNESSEDYLVHFFLTKKGKALLELASPGGAGRNKTLGQKEFENLTFAIPTLPEQQKIASFLTAIDTKINQLTRKKQLLEQYKKGVMQKIFNQEIRFKIPNEAGELVELPEWDMLSADEIFKNHTNKNHNGDLPILAATQDKGVVLRDSIDIKIQSSEASINSYKIVEKGDFVISLRSFQGGIEFSEVTGICSPAYTILKNKLPINNQFYKYYFKKESFIQQLSSTVIGIRDGKQISFDAFSTLMLYYPSVLEQQKIASFLTVIDTKITQTTQQLERTQTYKKGLLQQMFV